MRLICIATRICILIITYLAKILRVSFHSFPPPPALSARIFKNLSDFSKNVWINNYIFICNIFLFILIHLDGNFTLLVVSALIGSSLPFLSYAHPLTPEKKKINKKFLTMALTSCSPRVIIVIPCNFILYYYSNYQQYYRYYCAHYYHHRQPPSPRWHRSSKHHVFSLSLSRSIAFFDRRTRHESFTHRCNTHIGASFSGSRSHRDQ